MKSLEVFIKLAACSYGLDLSIKHHLAFSTLGQRILRSIGVPVVLVLVLMIMGFRKIIID